MKALLGFAWRRTLRPSARRLSGGSCSLRALLAFALIVSAASCASSSGSQVSPAGLDQLTGEQLRAGASSPDEPVYAILVRMRPQWLIARSGEPDVVVFVDNVPTGSPATLQVIGSSRVASLRFLEAESAARAHPGVTGPAIEVRLNP
jgi:hypothetical protein